MDLGALVSLEDISHALPSYDEEVVSVEMDPILAKTYEQIEADIKRALEEHRGNQSVMESNRRPVLRTASRISRAKPSVMICVQRLAKSVAE